MRVVIHPRGLQREEIIMDKLLTQALRLWTEFGGDAEWTPFDNVDAYCSECSICLIVDGFTFEGTGTICCGDREIDSLKCTTPNGTELTLA